MRSNRTCGLELRSEAEERETLRRGAKRFIIRQWQNERRERNVRREFFIFFYFFSSTPLETRRDDKI